MNLTHLEITRKEYINILNNRVIDVSPNISTNKLLKKMKCLKKKDLKHLASIRNVSISDDMSTEEIVNTIYRHHHGKKQRIIKEILTSLGLTQTAERQNISTSDGNKIARLNDISHNTLKRIAKLDNIKNYNNLTKEDLIYTLLRSQKSPRENNYLRYITSNINNKVKAKINDIRIELAELGKAINKIDKENIRKELNEIEKKTKLSRKQREDILRRLIEISNHLSYKKKYIHINFNDQSYYGISDVEHLHETLIAIMIQY